MSLDHPNKSTLVTDAHKPFHCVAMTVPYLVPVSVNLSTMPSLQSVNPRCMNELIIVLEDLVEQFIEVLRESTIYLLRIEGHTPLVVLKNRIVILTPRCASTAHNHKMIFTPAVFCVQAVFIMMKLSCLVKNQLSLGYDKEH